MMNVKFVDNASGEMVTCLGMAKDLNGDLKDVVFRDARGELNSLSYDNFNSYYSIATNQN